MDMLFTVMMFVWENDIDTLSRDTVVRCVLDDYTGDTNTELLRHAKEHFDWHDYNEFVGRVWRVCQHNRIDTEFINDTFWDRVSQCIDMNIVDGDWDFSMYTDNDDGLGEHIEPVDYDETRGVAEWRVMYNMGHDFHWAWRETYDGSLECMVDYVLTRVRDRYPNEWAAQNYPDIVA